MEQRDVASCCYHIEDHAALDCSTAALHASHLSESASLWARRPVAIVPKLEPGPGWEQ